LIYLHNVSDNKNVKIAGYISNRLAVDVYVEESAFTTNTKINYCPMCGRKL
jgi:hypothetical protein